MVAEDWLVDRGADDGRGGPRGAEARIMAVTGTVVTAATGATVLGTPEGGLMT